MPEYKNEFAEPDHYEHVITGPDGKKVGTWRLKPSTVLWKPVNAQDFYSVPLDKFAAWITDPATKAKRVSK